MYQGYEENFTKMVMKAGDKHWKTYTTNFDGVLTLRIYLQRITDTAAEILKIFKFTFFLVAKWYLGNLNKVIISRTFYKLYELPMNSINRESKYPKSHVTNGFKF